MGWQPIETAPKDVMLIVSDGTITAPGIQDCSGHWDFWEGGVIQGEYGDPLGELNYWINGHGPTNWWDFGNGQAMPEPPK